jgi:hypothetical protein
MNSALQVRWLYIAWPCTCHALAVGPTSHLPYSPPPSHTRAHTAHTCTHTVHATHSHTHSLFNRTYTAHRHAHTQTHAPSSTRTHTQFAGTGSWTPPSPPSYSHFLVPQPCDGHAFSCPSLLTSLPCVLATQCLSASWPLSAYFLTNRYVPDLNPDNVLGTSVWARDSCAPCSPPSASSSASFPIPPAPSRRRHARVAVSCGPAARAEGVLAQAFAELVQSLWLGAAPSVAPLGVKRAVGAFNKQFSGFAQHDAQVWVWVLCVFCVFPQGRALSVRGNHPPPRLTCKRLGERDTPPSHPPTSTRTTRPLRVLFPAPWARSC